MWKPRTITDERDARGCLSAAKRSGETLPAWARRNGVDGRSLHAWHRRLTGGVSPAESGGSRALVELVPIRSNFSRRPVLT